jgi:5-methylthioadenosine/S-adenosylhomocysteine deaminase
LDWLKKYIWAWEGSLTKETARACAQLAYLELLKSGVTTFVDYTTVKHTDEAFKVAKEFGMRGNLGKTLMDRNSPKELQESTDKCLKDTEYLIKKFHNTENDRLRYFITPRFGITCTDDLLLGCKELSKNYNVILTTHAHESQFEIQSDNKNYKKSAIKHFNELGLLGPNLLLAHCVWLTDEEMKLLAKTKTNVVHCPGSNMMLASGIADIPKMIESKITVGLGCDMAAHYNMSVFEQMRLACLLQKVKTLNPLALDHQDAFKFATLGGAKAVGLGKTTGSLEPGKKADIVLISTNNTSFVPLNSIVSQIVYSAYPSNVDTVICDGNVLMREGNVKVVDESKILENASDLLSVFSNSKS